MKASKDKGVEKFIYLHRFFVRESKRFVGVYKPRKGRYVYNWRDKLYFPIAYLKFMYYSFFEK